MAVAVPVPEQRYRYLAPSEVVDLDGRPGLRLATSGGAVPNPSFFRGTLVQPILASDLLLTVGDVVRARFHVPPAMLKRTLELADPVATCADDRLRFEAFSACCSVYGRVDVLPDGFEGEILGRGTTNVDFGPGVRSALAGVGDRGRLGLAVGPDAVEVETDAARAIERRVPLPARWLRGFLEVQAIQAELEPVAELDPAGTRAFFRSIPKAPSRRPVWIAPEPGGLRIVHHDPGGDAVPVAGLARLRLFERIARHAGTLRLFALPGDGSTGWQVDVPGARLTLVLSPDVWRGFSGEGRALHRLARAAPPGSVAAVRGVLGWEPRLGIADLAARTGRSTDVVSSALAALALSGIVGYDLADRAWFRRELPFAIDRTERLQPRLRDARRLLEGGAVRIDAPGPEIAAWVGGPAGTEYRVRSTAAGWTCTCPWFGRHRAERGPCKHVLAVQLAATVDDR